MTSPTQRSLALIKQSGWTAQIVEHWNAYAKVRVDLFDCIDIVVLTGYSILGIQTTSDSNLSARVKKALESPKIKLWLESGGCFECWGWGKKGPKGKRKLWTLRSISFSIVENLIVAAYPTNELADS